MARVLFPRPALRILHAGLAQFGAFALGLADDERAAADVRRCVDLIFRQINFSLSRSIAASVFPP